MNILKLSIRQWAYVLSLFKKMWIRQKTAVRRWCRFPISLMNGMRRRPQRKSEPSIRWKLQKVSEYPQPFLTVTRKIRMISRSGWLMSKLPRLYERFSTSALQGVVLRKLQDSLKVKKCLCQRHTLIQSGEKQAILCLQIFMAGTVPLSNG